MITFPLVRLGQTSQPLSPEAQRLVDAQMRALEPQIKALEAEIRDEAKAAATKAAIIGGSVGLVLGIFLTPIIQDMMGTVRVKKADLERAGLELTGRRRK